MITKEQIEARFELELLNPLVKGFKANNKPITLELILTVWSKYLTVCYENKEINRHQYVTWVLPKKYGDLVKG